MSLSSANRSLQLLMRLVDPKSATEPMIDTLPPKPEITSRNLSSTLPRHKPERHGISSSHIQGFLEALANDPSIRLHSVMIIRNGCVLCEASFGAQDLSVPRMTFSACKSITALAIGLLMDDGLLHENDLLTELFPKEGRMISRHLMRTITVGDLLSMRTGNQFNEFSCMTQSDWLEGFFQSPGLGAKKFHYNSLNTYILSRIVCKLSNKSLTQFLNDRLFEPMGISDFFWETCPEGYEKGGWGLYMRAEDLGKLGQLIQNNGNWNGRQLISHEFLQKATSAQAIAPESCGDFNYGWQFWVGRTSNKVLMNGMLGQNVLCYRDSGITIVSHAGNDEVFQQSNYFTLAEKFFGGTFSEHLSKDFWAHHRLHKFCKTLSNSRQNLPSPKDLSHFAEICYSTNSPRSASVGLLPVTLQAVQNCYTKGFRSISISGNPKKIEIVYKENGSEHHIIAGTKTSKEQLLTFGENTFRVAAQARFTHNEDDDPVFILKLDFLETPCTRIIKLIKTDQGVVLQQSETPCIDRIFNSVLTGSHPAIVSLLSSVFGTGDLEFLRWRMSLIFSPAIELSQIKKEGA